MVAPVAPPFALVFPGQGSEVAEMGLALAAVDARARGLLASASRATGLDVERALAVGSRALSQTEVLQPVLLAVGLGAARALEARGLAPALVAGHSLGELTAACFALDVADADAVELAALRGRLMSDAARARPGGMLSVRAEHDAVLAPALALGLTLALHNAPDERVLSGDVALLAQAERALARPTSRLRVAGAWHSPSMEPVVAPFRSAARPLADRALLHTLLSGVEARALAAHEIPDALARGLTRPVRWVDLLEGIVARGLTDVVVAPPSRVLRALVRRTLGDRVVVHDLTELALDPTALGRPG